MQFQYVEILGKEFFAWIPETDLERTNGLSDLAFFPSNWAMIFNDPGRYFNTVHMKFAIDILCFDHNDNLVQTILNCKPGLSSILICKECKCVVELKHGALESAQEKNETNKS